MSRFTAILFGLCCAFATSQVQAQLLPGLSFPTFRNPFNPSTPNNANTHWESFNTINSKAYQNQQARPQTTLRPTITSTSKPGYYNAGPMTTARGNTVYQNPLTGRTQAYAPGTTARGNNVYQNAQGRNTVVVAPQQPRTFNQAQASKTQQGINLYNQAVANGYRSNAAPSWPSKSTGYNTKTARGR